MTALPATGNGEAVNDYEVIGRVVAEKDALGRERYWVELPVWDNDEEGPDWSRQERSYLLQRGALRAITDPPPAGLKS